MNVEEFLSAHCDKLINGVRVRVTCCKAVLTRMHRV